MLAVRTDASFGSGHWYEGGGLFRPVHLIVAPTLHIVQDGVYVVAEGSGNSYSVSVEIENQGAAAVESYTIGFHFTFPNGQTILTNSTAFNTALAAGSVRTHWFNGTFPHPVARWTLASPTVMNFTVSLSSPNTGADTHSVWTAARTTRWDPNTGFYLNDQHVKFRGFSHHNSFGGLGVSLPDRVHLFRVQSSRALGANIWRMRCGKVGKW